jgi:hypothetical protein
VAREERPRAVKSQNCELAFDGFDTFQARGLGEVFELEHLPWPASYRRPLRSRQLACDPKEVAGLSCGWLAVP